MGIFHLYFNLSAKLHFVSIKLRLKSLGQVKKPKTNNMRLIHHIKGVITLDMWPRRHIVHKNDLWWTQNRTTCCTNYLIWKWTCWTPAKFCIFWTLITKLWVQDVKLFHNTPHLSFFCFLNIVLLVCVREIYQGVARNEWVHEYIYIYIFDDDTKMFLHRLFIVSTTFCNPQFAWGQM